MKMNDIAKAFSGKVYRAKIKVAKHSPEILFGIGLVGIGVGTVMACKSTLKANNILKEHHDNIENAKAARKLAQENKLTSEYTDDDYKHDVTLSYKQTGIKILKEYAAPVAVMTVSIGCLGSSNSILRKRSVAIAAAYATLDESFKKYRSRVIDKFGEEVDAQMRHGIKKVTVKEESIDEKTGEKKVVKKEINVVDSGLPSDYARYFEKTYVDADGTVTTNDNWDTNENFNLMFLRGHQDYFNDLLRINKIVFLNDVYKTLGFPPTKAGQMVGWVLNNDDPVGDNYIDFRASVVNKPAKNGGYERTILIDPNVDGNVWDLMKI